MEEKRFGVLRTEKEVGSRNLTIVHSLASWYVRKMTILTLFDCNKD